MVIRDAVDKAQEQIVKARKEEARKEEEHAKGQNPVTSLRDNTRQSPINQQSDGGKSATCNPKGYVPECRFSPLLTMLTLDETTLFYYSLSLSKDKKVSSLIKDWSKFVDNSTKPKLPSNTHGSSTSTTLASNTQARARGTKVSPLTDQVVITSREEGPKSTLRSKADLSLDDVSGGLSNEDEVQGAEREEAVNSPPKGKVRATNAVSHYNFNWLIHILIYLYSRILLRLT